MSNNCKCNKRGLEYATAYIMLQKYENLYPIYDALGKGTIFKDLYRPYKKRNKKD